MIYDTGQASWGANLPIERMGEGESGGEVGVAVVRGWSQAPG